MNDQPDAGGPDPPTYRLTIKAQPDEAPPVIRLRQVLKRLLRSFAFRCVEVMELKDDKAIPVDEEEPR
jgi:hypothetical protein